MKVIPKKFSITDTHILVAFKQIWKYLITKYKYKFKYRVKYLDLDEIKEAIDIFDDIRQPKYFPGNADGDKRIKHIISDYYNSLRMGYKPCILYDIYREDIWDENIERKWDTELFDYLDKTIFILEQYYGKIDTWKKYILDMEETNMVIKRNGTVESKIILKDILPCILNHTSSGQLNSSEKDVGCYRILIPGDNTRWIETNDRGKPICMFCGHPEEGKDPYKILSNYRNTRVTSIECIRDKYIEHGNQLFVEIQLESPVELINDK